MARRGIIFAALFVAVLPAVAWAHGDVASTNPEADGVVHRPPGKVSVTLTETPTKDAVLRVVDGCNKQVAAAVAVKDETITASLQNPQPGHFRVRWKAISAVDGHPTDGKFFFHVEGRPRCSQASGGNGGTNGGNGDGTDTGNNAPPGNDAAAPAAEGESTSLPYVLGGIGLVAVIGIALIARRGAR